MKMDTSLLQSDPEALDQCSMQSRHNNEVSFLNRVQKNIQRHQFIHIIKVTLYLELLLAIGVIGFISLSNYYSHHGHNNDDAPYDPLTPVSDRIGNAFLLNSKSVPRERISLRTKEADAIVSIEPSQIASESNIEAINGFFGTEEPTSTARTIINVEKDNSNRIMNDLPNIKEIFVDNVDTPLMLPNLEQISVINGVNLEINGSDQFSPLLREDLLPDLDIKDDNVLSDEDDISKYTFSSELEDDQFLRKILQSLPYDKRLLAGSDIDSDSGSWDDTVPPLDAKTKRSADSSSSESSSSSSDSSSSSSESGSSESSSSKKAAIKLLSEILTKMEKSDCTEPSNVNVEPNSDHKKYVKSLKDKLVKWITKTPVPDCVQSSASLAVDNCGNLLYKCPNDEIENEQLEEPSSV